MSSVRGFLFPLFLLLAGCLLPPQPVDVVGDPSTARALLVARLREGPVPTVIRGGLETLPPERLAEAAAAAVPALEPDFRPRSQPPAEDAYLLIVLHGGEAPLPRQLCRDANRLSTEFAERVAAAWCEKARTVAAVELPTGDPGARGVERAVWRAMAALFPDDYADTYGFDLFGQRITIGGTFGF